MQQTSWSRASIMLFCNGVQTVGVVLRNLSSGFVPDFIVVIQQFLHSFCPSFLCICNGGSREVSAVEVFGHSRDVIGLYHAQLPYILEQSEWPEATAVCSVGLIDGLLVHRTEFLLSEDYREVVPDVTTVCHCKFCNTYRGLQIVLINLPELR